MPCHAGWKLQNPRPIHFKLAEYLAQGKTPKECSRLTGLCYEQVSRLRGSPIIQSMITQARQSRLQADALAKQDFDGLLALQEYKLLIDLNHIRDFDANAKHRLSAASKSQRLIEHLRERQKSHAQTQERDEIHIIIQDSQDSEDAP